VTQPSLANVITFLLAVIAWLAVTLGTQGLILRWRRRRR
jgi:hypothetical protein